MAYNIRYNKPSIGGRYSLAEEYSHQGKKNLNESIQYLMQALANQKQGSKEYNALKGTIGQLTGGSQEGLTAALGGNQDIPATRIGSGGPGLRIGDIPGAPTGATATPSGDPGVTAGGPSGQYAGLKPGAAAGGGRVISKGGPKDAAGVIKQLNAIAAGAGYDLGASNTGKALNAGLDTTVVFRDSKNPNSLASFFLQKGATMSGATRQSIPIGQGYYVDVFSTPEKERLGFALDRIQKNLMRKAAGR